MNHEAYREQLSALLDGELSDAERADVLAHLETCEGCRAYLAELTAMRGALGDLAEIDAPEDFADGVLARLRAETARRRSRRTWGALAACAAVVVLAVAALPRMGAGGGAPEESALTADAAPAEAEEPMTVYRAETEAADEGAAETNDAVCDEVPLAESAAATLTLRGAGAAAWLEEHGAADGEERCRVPVAALDELPEGLSLEGIVAPDEDGTVLIVPAEAEAAR